MQQTAGDGLSVNYSPYPRTSDLGEYCTPQTVGNSFNFNLGGAPSTASPGSKVTKPSGGLVLTPASEQPRLPSSSEVSPIQFQEGLFPQLQSIPPAALTASSNRVLPTPPPTNTYEVEGLHGLDHLNSSVLPVSTFSSGLDCFTSSQQNSLGRGPWPASHPLQLEYTQTAWSMPEQQQGQDLTQNLSQNLSQNLGQGLSMMPSASAGHYSPPLGTSAYGTPSFNLPNQMEHTPIAHREEGVMMPDLGAQSSSQPMQQHVSPQHDGEIAGSFQYGGGEVEDEAIHDPAGQAEQSDRDDGDNAGEHQPYAQLIWRAFKSRPDRTMTLQEIYQWFRDNTDKAKGEGKGWQNSIRHNLSMNQAFTKVDRQVNPEDASSNSQEAKKSSAWVLEDWAIDGVQSTTRYRKGNPSRRGGGSVAQQRRHENIVARATAGRRGITTPSRIRTAVSRRTAPSRAQHPELFGAQPTPFTNADYHRPFDYPQLQVSGDMFSPLPARNMEDLGTLFPQSIHSNLPVAPLQAASSGQEYTYASPHGQGIPEYMQRGYHHDAYGLGGPAGAYPGQQQSARHSREMPLIAPGYSEPFTQDEDYPAYSGMEQQYHP